MDNYLVRIIHRKNILPRSSNTRINLRKSHQGKHHISKDVIVDSENVHFIRSVWKEPWIIRIWTNSCLLYSNRQTFTLACYSFLIGGVSVFMQPGCIWIWIWIIHFNRGQTKVRWLTSFSKLPRKLYIWLYLWMPIALSSVISPSWGQTYHVRSF